MILFFYTYIQQEEKRHNGKIEIHSSTQYQINMCQKKCGVKKILEWRLVSSFPQLKVKAIKIVSQIFTESGREEGSDTTVK